MEIRIVIMIILFGMQSDVYSAYTVQQDTSELSSKEGILIATDSLSLEEFRAEYSDKLRKGLTDESISMADSLILTAKRSNIHDLISEAYYLKTRSLIAKGDFESANLVMDSCRSVIFEQNDSTAWSKYGSLLARDLAEQGRINESVVLFEEVTELLREMKDTAQLARTIGNMGIVRSWSGDKPGALESYLESVVLKRILGDSIGLGMTLNSIGNLFREMGQYEEAEKYLQEGLDLFSTLEHDIGRGSALSNLGSVEQLRGNYDKAMDYYQSSLEIKRKSGHTRGTVVSLINCASVADIQGDYKKSLEYLEEAQVLITSGGMDSYLSSVEIGISRALLKEGKVIDAIKVARRAYARASEGGDFNDIMDSSMILSECEQQLGNYRSALEYRLEYELFKDSVDNMEDKQKVMQMGFQHQFDMKHFADSLEFARKEAMIGLEIEKRDADLAKQRIGLAATGGGLLLLSLLMISIRRGKRRSDELLHNILPEEIAAELKEKGRADARNFERASILFTDFKEFTQTSEKLSAQELVSEINTCFEAFDRTCEKYGIEKIKTIGDAYMAAGGLPVPDEKAARNTVLAALEMQDFIGKRFVENKNKNKPAFEMRVGIHTGPVVAGIVGVKKFQYDIWGDTVNTASRMEFNGEVGKVNLSQATYELLKNDHDLTFEYRGKIEAKGKGAMEMWFVSRNATE